MKPKSIMKRYTPSDIAFLQANYATMNVEDIAEVLNKTARSIRCKANRLGLNRPTNGRMEKGTTRGEKSRFKKGVPSHNKGVPMPDSVREKVAHTMFKKGQNPHNTKQDGHITIRETKGRPYKWIRIAENKWELFHRVVWKRHNGDIPEGMIVTFIDGDQSNCNISNLKLMTRKENVKRNQIHSYPQELKDTIKVLNKFRKKLKTQKL